MDDTTPLSKGKSLGPDRNVSGRLRTISVGENIHEVEQGDIVYVPNPNDDDNNVVFFYQLFKAGAAGFLCSDIGRTDHRVVLANELGIPCLSEVCSSIADYSGSVVTIHGDTIYEGRVFENETLAPDLDSLTVPETETSIKLNLGFPEIVDRKPEMTELTNGVGFMRLEFVLLKILDGLHPHEYVDRHGKGILAEEIADHIEPVLAAFEDPVWMRTDDFSVPQLKSMISGDMREGYEENPMLGWRGIARSIENSILIDAQFGAISRLLNRGYNNIGLFPPMTRFPREYREWKEMALDHGLEPVSFGIMVETPSAALTFEQFVDDISFAVFGSNDLTQFTLAIDRSNESLYSEFDEKEDAVLLLFERVISIANDHDVETYIGGQAGSDQDLMSILWNSGITGFSVTPDFRTIAETKSLLRNLEDRGLI